MFIKLDGMQHPRPAPRMSHTPGAIRSNAPIRGQDTHAVLRENGFSEYEISKLANGEAAN
jgi:alpha-methylacyl-CoA racemase